MAVAWLADIPLEVREMIYHKIFTDLRLRPFQLLKQKPENDQDRHAGFGLFFVNKQVYAEFKAIFLKEVTFDLRQPNLAIYDFSSNLFLVDELIRSKH